MATIAAEPRAMASLYRSSSEIMVPVVMKMGSIRCEWSVKLELLAFWKLDGHWNHTIAYLIFCSAVKHLDGFLGSE